MIDIIQRAQPWLNLCPACDVGLLKTCTCPKGDARSIILDLVLEVQRLRKKDAV